MIQGGAGSFGRKSAVFGLKEKIFLAFLALFLRGETTILKFFLKKIYFAIDLIFNVVKI